MGVVDHVYSVLGRLSVGQDYQYMQFSVWDFMYRMITSYWLFDFLYKFVSRSGKTSYKIPVFALLYLKLIWRLIQWFAFFPYHGRISESVSLQILVYVLWDIHDWKLRFWYLHFWCHFCVLLSLSLVDEHFLLYTPSHSQNRGLGKYWLLLEWGRG